MAQKVAVQSAARGGGLDWKSSDKPLRFHGVEYNNHHAVTAAVTYWISVSTTFPGLNFAGYGVSFRPTGARCEDDLQLGERRKPEDAKAIARQHADQAKATATMAPDFPDLPACLDRRKTQATAGTALSMTLPLYPSEAAIADTVLGPGRRDEWKGLVQVLEREGFPPITMSQIIRCWPSAAMSCRRKCSHGLNRPARVARRIMTAPTPRLYASTRRIRTHPIMNCTRIRSGPTATR